MIITDPVWRKIVQTALMLLFKNEARIISRRVREETINHRLAVYLENEMKQNAVHEFLNIDLEYNKNYDRAKEIVGIDGKVYKIRPDILVHLREDNYNNKIAFECKINRMSPHDKEKLLKLKSPPYNYENCLGIVYKPGVDYFFIYHIENDVLIKTVKNKQYFELG